MDLATLFIHLDRVEIREKPLPSIRDVLESEAGNSETDQTCIDDDCDGTLWDVDSGLICEKCSVIKDGSTSRSNQKTRWEYFRENRPTYHYSNRRRQVGGFNHEWVESDDAEDPVSDLPPEEFYRS